MRRFVSPCKSWAPMTASVCYVTEKVGSSFCVRNPCTSKILGSHDDPSNQGVLAGFSELDAFRSSVKDSKPPRTKSIIFLEVEAQSRALPHPACQNSTSNFLTIGRRSNHNSTSGAIALNPILLPPSKERKYSEMPVDRAGLHYHRTLQLGEALHYCIRPASRSLGKGDEVY